MPAPQQICIEDLRSSTPDARYLRCVAVAGRAPGLRVDARGRVLWRSDDAVACELWVSLDDKLVLYRPEGAAPVRVERGGRALDVAPGRPVILIDQDLVLVGGRELRVHVHGEAPEVHAPAFVTEAMLRAARAVSAAALVGAAAAGCSSGAAPIEVRERPPAVMPMPPPSASAPTTSASTATPTSSTTTRVVPPPPR